MILINNDCFNEFKNIEKEIDLILVDVPYGTIKNVPLNGYTNKDTSWDVTFDIKEMIMWCNKLLRENGYMVIFSQGKYTADLRSYYHNNLKFLYDAIWEKDHFANPLISKKALVKYYEDISIFCKKYDDNNKNEIRNYSRKILQELNLTISKVNNILGHRKAEHFFYCDSLQFKLCTKKTYEELVNVFKLDKYDFYLTYEELKLIYLKYSKTFNTCTRSNIFKYKKDYMNMHPTQKPIKLLEELIRIYSNKNDIVLDFCFGSCSTGIAANNMKRKFIGIEKDKKYFDTALSWIKKYYGLNEYDFEKNGNKTIIHNILGE